MTAYYNEHDPYAAQWLRNLIEAGLLAPGVVDERSIEDVTPDELREYTQCHFFAGIGIWPAALRDAGWPDDRPVWTGSCPCQPFSAIGKREGTSDERHLWPAWDFLIEQCGPSEVFGEQVASPDGTAWLDTVSTDLEAKGYAVGAFDLCAAGFGAPHPRQRHYFVARLAHGEQSRLEGHSGNGGRGREPGRLETVPARSAPARSYNGAPRAVNGFWADAVWLAGKDGFYRPVQPGSFPMAHGYSDRVEALHAFGNAIVRPQAQAFIEAYLETETSVGGRSSRITHGDLL